MSTEIQRLTKEYNRIARLLESAEERAANAGTGLYSESQAQADSRYRRSQATIRKHRATLASLDRQITNLEQENT